MASKNGQCLCGAVKFELKEEPDHYHTCYCKMCQRWTGSAFSGFSAYYKDLNVSGEENINNFQSSDWAHRAFCKKCGTGLWYQLADEDYEGGDTFIPIGVLDDIEGLTLTTELFSDCKSSAFNRPANVAQVTEAEIQAQFASPEDS